MSASEASSFETKLDVPHVSQRLAVPLWNEPHRACGMVCVYMALKYYEDRGLTNRPIPDLDTLIQDGRLEGGLLEGIGWVHDYLVNTFQRFGINCSREEGMDPEWWVTQGFAQIIEHSKDPILISTVHVRFGPNDRLTHIVLLTGVKRSADGTLEGFFFHDANVYKEGEGEHVFVSVENLPLGWRRMAILPCTKA